ncbi:MAG: hypothetical protein ACRDHN_00560 [Thermomicrobiales bacterium]
MDVDALLEGLQQYAIHGSIYYRVFFSHEDDPETIHQAQLPNDAFDTTLLPGAKIRVTYLLKTVMKIERR